MNTQDRTKQEIRIKQLLTYAPIANGGQKLAALDESGVVCIYDDVKEEWIATNTPLKQPEKQEIERLNVALEVNHSPILSIENKLNEVIEAVNKLLEK